MTNRIHKTKSGTVQLVGEEWLDGRMPKASAGVACLTVHDDVTNAVWKFTGKRRDAAQVIGHLYIHGGRFPREKVAVLSEAHIEIEAPPSDLWIGKGAPNSDGEFDEFEFNVAAHPDIVAY